MRYVWHFSIVLLCLLVTGCSVSSKRFGVGQRDSPTGFELSRASAPLAPGMIITLDESAETSEGSEVSEVAESSPISESESPQNGADEWGISLSLSSLDEIPTILSESIEVPEKKARSPSDASLQFRKPIRRDAQPVVWQVSASKEESIIEPLAEIEAPVLSPFPESTAALQLQDVIDSVYASYPMLAVAFLSRSVADGKLLSSSGEFDLKLKGDGTTGPLGFYETNRFGAGARQPLFSGGEIFGGYKIGRGNFQPWYGERNTNDGGEFSAGIAIPLAQNRDIDARRAALYRATFGRDAVEPDIQAQIISFVWESSYAYWEWVAAGRNQQIALSLLEIAQERNVGLVKRVDVGDLAKIELTDNQRLIVSREAALIDAERKLQQSAIKLSLFLRTLDGQPIIPSSAQLPEKFPDATPINFNDIDSDIQIAMANRPELASLEFLRRQYHVDLNQARNLYLPKVDGVLFASKDVGAAASSKGDKTPFEFEASLQISVPLQRRKALGKVQSIEGKLTQLSVKIGFTQDKIATDVQGVYAALRAAFQRIVKAEESLDFARIMEQAERDSFDLGNSDLLKVNLREKATASAAKTVLQAKLDYYQAQADYRAAMAMDVNLESVQ